MTDSKRALREMFSGVRLSDRLPPDDELARLTDDPELQAELREAAQDVLDRLRAGANGDAQVLGERHAERLSRATGLADVPADDELAGLSDDELAELAYQRGRGRMADPAAFRREK